MRHQDIHHRDNDHDALHHQGLARDLEVLLRRRGALRWLVGAGALPLVGCGGGGDSSSSTAAAATTGTTTGTATGTTTGTTTGSTTTTTGGTTTTTSNGSCSLIPNETEGPYPGDGSNTSGGSIANALALSGIVRSDIRSSIGNASGTAQGVPLTLTLKLVNSSNNADCASLAGYAIYVWHCDRDGNYSMYSGSAASQNYLRGVQQTGSDGSVTFTTIFPACYSGRWPHIHFEVYRSTTTATSYSNKLRTSQLALPADVCQTVYSTASGYGSSLTNLSRVSLATDGIFSDGYASELAAVTGSVSAGYAATLTVGISV